MYPERVNAFSDLIKDDKHQIQSMSLSEMDEYWDKAKIHLRKVKK